MLSPISKRALVVGMSGGIGLAMAHELHRRFPHLELHGTFHRHRPASATLPAGALLHPLNLHNVEEIEVLLARLGELDLLLNCAGQLHTEQQGPEKSLRQLDPEFFLNSMAVNALPTCMLAKYAASNFRHSRPAIFAAISAKVGSIEDNHLGGWTSYRCSKAALNMALKNISIEWRRGLKNVNVASLHPGTTDTSFSRPFQKNVAPEKLFSPAHTAHYLCDVLDQLTPETSGQFWSWDGTTLPW